MVDSLSSTSHSGRDVLVQSLKEIPAAASELVQEAWEHKWDTTKSVVKTAVTAGITGAAFGLVIPARGPAALAATAAFTAPLLFSQINRFKTGYDAAQGPGADLDGIAHHLARGTVKDLTNFGLSAVVGSLATGGGHRLATSDTTIGAWAQSAQRGIVRAENKGALGVRRWSQQMGIAEESAAATAGSAETFRLASLARPTQAFSSRLRQAEALTAETTKWHQVSGDLHGHSHFSDGMGTPRSLYKKAKEGGKDFWTNSDHNHDGSRDAVTPGDARRHEHDNVPINTENPASYTKTMAAAQEMTEDGKFIALWGIESGTIGKPQPPGTGGRALVAEGIVAGPAKQPPLDLGSRTETVLRVHEPDGTINVHGYTFGEQPSSLQLGQGLNVRRAQSLSLFNSREMNVASNHSIVYDSPTFIQAIRHRKPHEAHIAGETKAAAAGAQDRVLTYDDGDYNALTNILNGMTDTTGKPIVMAFAHPRAPQGLPSDYGRLSFKNDAEWVKNVGRHASLIEVITGQALNPEKVWVMKGTDLSPKNMAYYIDREFHLGPTFGGDQHFGNPNARPAATLVLLDGPLTKANLLEGLRNRQTSATTSNKLLRGYSMGNDVHPNGKILDQNAVPDLNISMHIDGKVDPKAKYSVTLWGDTKVGDRTLAQKLQTQKLTGQEVLDASNQVGFDTLRHTIGNKSAYYVEVQRVDPRTKNTDYLWTAPIYVEPSVGARHSLLSRSFLSGGIQSLWLGGATQGQPVGMLAEAPIEQQPHNTQSI